MSAPARLPSPASPFCHALRVYWEDTDAGGVVFYANYLRFFERARTEWLRSLGIAQRRLRDDTGTIFVVTESALHYRAPARLDDWLQVTVAVTDLGPATITLEQQARRDDAVLCEGRIRIACVDGERLRPRRIPPEVSRAWT